MLTPVFKPFVEESPISIMARGMIERVLNPDQLNQWFNTTAKNQYTKDLLFSSLFDIMSLVVQPDNTNDIKRLIWATEYL